MKHQHLFFLLMLSFILIMKLIPLPSDIEKICEGSESDLNQYLRTTSWLIGQPLNETGRAYQYPPLYPFLLLPTVFMDTTLFVLLLNIFLSVLTFFPLYLISRRYTGFYESTLIAGFIILINFIFTIKSYGYPMILSALLFSWFLYHFQNAEDETSFLYASLCFGLLLFTKYVFFYLLPFILIWLWLTQRNRLRQTVFFGIIPLAFVMTWTLRNIFLHGMSLKGAVGGYHTIVTETPLQLYIGTIPAKLESIFTMFEPNLVVTYFCIFLVGMVLFWKRLGMPSQKDKVWYLVLLFNFLVFFLLPAMTYDRSYLNWRYLSTLTPAYLLFAFIPFATILKKGFRF